MYHILKQYQVIYSNTHILRVLLYWGVLFLIYPKVKTQVQKCEDSIKQCV